MKLPKTFSADQKELFKSVNTVLADRRNSFTDLVVYSMCELWAKWEEYKDETQTQQFYMGLSSLKQLNVLAKQLDLFSKQESSDKPNAFDAFLKKRVPAGSKN